MKRLILICLILFAGFSAILAQDVNSSPDEIKKQMAEIRRKTDWSDPAAAKKANAQIEDLSAKLTAAIRKQKAAAQGGGSTSTDTVKQNLQKEIDNENDALWNQMMKIIREGGPMDLAAPLREEIVKEYIKDETPVVKNPEFAADIHVLMLNMSMKGIQIIIDQMPNFKSITTLIITTNDPGTSVDLDQILEQARDYNLKELYVINFGTGVTSLPPKIGDFKELQILGLYHNNLQSLPSSFSALSELTTLYVDLNPLGTLQPVVQSFTKLETLGVAKTSIPASEISQIQQLLPKCKILEK